MTRRSVFLQPRCGSSDCRRNRTALSERLLQRCLRLRQARRRLLRPAPYGPPRDGQLRCIVEAQASDREWHREGAKRIAAGIWCSSVERQATYQHRQVSYHRHAADGVYSTVDIVNFQQLIIARRNWHGRSLRRTQAPCPVSAGPGKRKTQ
jgi:hypothetical protein